MVVGLFPVSSRSALYQAVADSAFVSLTNRVAASGVPLDWLNVGAYTFPALLLSFHPIPSSSTASAAKSNSPSLVVSRSSFKAIGVIGLLISTNEFALF